MYTTALYIEGKEYGMLSQLTCKGRMTYTLSKKDKNHITSE